MDFASITHVHYAFFDVTSACVVTSLDPYADYERMYPELGMSWTDDSIPRGNVGAFKILRERFPHLHVAVSLGGWTKSTYFSGCAKDPAKRAKLVASTIQNVQQDGWDGVDGAHLSEP
jgi:GH18 family chitinase